MIEAIIHVNNRIQFLSRAVASAVVSAADLEEVQVLISSNATDEKSAEYAERIADKNGIPFSRNPPSSAAEHLCANIRNSNAEYVCLLHDDDIILECFFKNLLCLLAKYPEGVAYSTDNKFLIHENLYSTRLILKEAFKISPSVLIMLYLLNRCGPVFPSVLYEKKFAENVFSEPRLHGKYFDADVLVKAARLGFYVSKEPSFIYVMGYHNDSLAVDAMSRSRLRQWLLVELLRGLTFKKMTDFQMNIKYFIGRFYKKRGM